MAERTGAVHARELSVGVLLIAAVAAGMALVAPYAVPELGAGRLEVRNSAHAVLLRVHVLTAFAALVLGPAQFLPRLRARRRLHRLVGRAYLFAGVLPSALAGVPVALMSERGPVTQVGLFIPALAWLVTGALALQAARRRDFVAHAEWMARNYALTFLAVTSRAVVPLLLLAQIPVMGSVYGSVEAAVAASIPVGQWLGWIVNLVVAEMLIRRQRARGR
ncbi:DUF2306 domain-containing protein [Streptomonospora sediminis]